MSDYFDVAIIGGGITGLIAGYKLAKQGKKVIVFEKSQKTGGLIRHVTINNYNIEGFYHHFFIDDKPLIELLNELNVTINWQYTNTAFLYNYGLFKFSQAIDLLKFSPLSFIEKIKLGFFLTRILKITDLTHYDNITIKEWACQNLGEELYKKFIEPLLWAKFNKDMNNISAAWFIGRINMRGKRSLKGEKLGYINGGYKTFLSALEKNINDLGGKILFNSPVIKISKTIDENFEIHTSQAENNTFHVKNIINTIHPGYLSKFIEFPIEFIKQVDQLKYQGSICILFALEKKLTDYYWINVMEKDINFGAIIEHTNFQPYTNYNEHLIYLASYPSFDSNLWKLDDAKIFDIYYKDLKKIFPKQCENNKINWYKIFRTFDAGLIYKIGIKSLIPEYKTPIKGIFEVGMFNCYPKRPINKLIINIKECLNLL